MVDFLLFRGGFHILPNKVVRALNVLDKYKELETEFQEVYIDLIIADYIVDDSELNKLRNKFLKSNYMTDIATTADIVQFLLNKGMVYVEDNSYRLNYNCLIEDLEFKLSKEVKSTISDLRSLYDISEQIVSYVDDYGFEDMLKMNVKEVAKLKKILDEDISSSSIELLRTLRKSNITAQEVLHEEIH